MKQISVLNIGLIVLLILVLISNILNYVSIATTQWIEESGDISLWRQCLFPNTNFRSKCFLDIPPILIAVGTVFNCLSLVFIISSIIALVISKFIKSFILYFLIIVEMTNLLGLLFRSIGWYFIFNYQYQNFVNSSFRYGWSFWLMTGSFSASVVTTTVNSFIIGIVFAGKKYNSRNLQAVEPICETCKTFNNNMSPSAHEYDIETKSFINDNLRKGTKEIQPVFVLQNDYPVYRL